MSALITSTACPPFGMVIGRHPNFPSDLGLNKIERVHSGAPRYMKELGKAMSHIQHKARTNIETFN